MGTIDINHLQSWQGRSETRKDLIAAFPANALAATLDRRSASSALALAAFSANP